MEKQIDSTIEEEFINELSEKFSNDTDIDNKTATKVISNFISERSNTFNVKNNEIKKYLDEKIKISNDIENYLYNNQPDSYKDLLNTLDQQLKSTDDKIGLIMQVSGYGIELNMDAVLEYLHNKIMNSNKSEFNNSHLQLLRKMFDKGMGVCPLPVIHIDNTNITAINYKISSEEDIDDIINSANRVYVSKVNANQLDDNSILDVKLLVL